LKLSFVFQVRKNLVNDVSLLKEKLFANYGPQNLLTTNQAPVVQKLDNTIHWINHYKADTVVCIINSYPLDNDIFGG